MSRIRREIHTVPQVVGVCVGLLFSAIFLTAYSSRHPHVANIGSRLLLEVTTPFSKTLHYVQDGVGSFLDRYLFLVDADRKNVELEARVQSLRLELELMREFEFENTRLRDVLALANKHVGETVAAASVIGGDPTGWVHSISIDKGSLAGVEIGMGVVNPEGIIGQIAAVSPHAARVILIDDPLSNVDVMLQQPRVRGLLEGAGQGRTIVQFVGKGQSVRIGDTIITSGMDSVFPKGLLVGRVEKVSHRVGEMFQEVEVAPAVSFPRVEEVLVVRGSK
jgi:rod shape-determining protein MreC